MGGYTSFPRHAIAERLAPTLPIGDKDLATRVLIPLVV